MQPPKFIPGHVVCSKIGGGIIETIFWEKDQWHYTIKYDDKFYIPEDQIVWSYNDEPIQTTFYGRPDTINHLSGHWIASKESLSQEDAIKLVESNKIARAIK